jgi:type III secretory pathway component EscR
MNQLRLFNRNYRKISLSNLFLAILVSSAIFPVQAQSQVTKVEISQTLTDTQKQDIKKQAEEFVELLGKKKSSQARAILAKKLQKNWTPEQIQALWETEIISQFGPFQKVVSSKAIDIINADVVKVMGGGRGWRRG